MLVGMMKVLKYVRISSRYFNSCSHREHQSFNLVYAKRMLHAQAIMAHCFRAVLGNSLNNLSSYSYSEAAEEYTFSSLETFH